MNSENENGITQAIAKRGKSRTYWLAVFVGASPFLYDNLPMLRELLGQNYNYVAYGLGALIAFCREITTKSIADK